ncbi:MAG: DUF362 domain-containing protein, partial [Pygmaiobacter sp.]
MNRVTVKTGLSYENPAALDAAVEAIFADSEHAATLGAASRVLLKPNLLAKHRPEEAVTTHPAVVAAVIGALRRRGVQDITLADSSGGIYTAGSMRAIYKASGLTEVCNELDVRLWEDTTSGTRAVDGVRNKEFQ